MGVCRNAPEIGEPGRGVPSGPIMATVLLAEPVTKAVPSRPKAMSKGWAMPSPVRFRAAVGVAVGEDRDRVVVAVGDPDVPLVVDSVACGQEMSPWAHPASGLTGVPSGWNCDTLLCVGGSGQFGAAKPKLPTQMSP